MNVNIAVAKSGRDKIVILGSGLLGKALIKELVDYQPKVLTHHDLDITNQGQVDNILDQFAPNVIINTAAYTKVDQCETEREPAWLVNGVAPRYLALAAKRLKASLIHYSTDYIFSGEQAAGYAEDAKNFTPINAYGESKLAGEQAILQVADVAWQKYYILRTAWLYGHSGTNFVDTMIALGQQRHELQVVNDQHGSPTFAQDLAKQTRWLIEQRPAGGIYHCTNSGQCTWFELAQAIFALNQQVVRVLPCASDKFPRPAKRPAYSILLNTKMPALRPWREALADYIIQRKDKL